MDAKATLKKLHERMPNLSIDELNEKRGELQTKFSQMVLESDLVMKIAIIESLLNY